MIHVSLSNFLHNIRWNTPHFRGKARLFRWFRNLTGRPRLTIPYGADGWITVDDEGEYIERFIWQHGVHEPEVWNALASVAEGDEVFWDIGANIGSLAIQGLQDSRIAEVHCFEPNPKTASLLRLNLNLNRGRYFVHEVGLSDSNGTLPLHLGSGSDIASFNRDYGSEDILVPVFTVDEIIASGKAPSPTLVKIDVEGWEENVLIGSHGLLKESPPKAITFEGECDNHAVLKHSAVSSLLREYGYTITHIPRPSGKLFGTAFGDDFIENFLARR